MKEPKQESLEAIKVLESGNCETLPEVKNMEFSELFMIHRRLD